MSAMTLPQAFLLLTLGEPWFLGLVSGEGAVLPRPTCPFVSLLVNIVCVVQSVEAVALCPLLRLLRY